MRPTGRLHLGHLHGALENWIRLQNEGNDTFFFVADWHALTTDWEKTKIIPESIREMVLDWLAVGLDPDKSTLFLQSKIKEHAELFLLLGMITPIGWLERNPTFKELQQEVTGKDLSNYGFLGYPVLQAADVLMYKANGVPVGQDQVPHLELTREIARRFNNTYKALFPEPAALLTKSPKIGGIDGRKMSKSYGNAIFLSDSEDDVKKKIKVMVTDPARKRREDPGNPKNCNLYPLHEIHSSTDTLKQVQEGCTTAGIGCVDCKNMLFTGMLPRLKEIREARERLESRPNEVVSALEKGNAKARILASKTMTEVNQAISLL